MLKSISGIFLILSLVLPFAGTFGWLQIKKFQVKKTIKHQVLAGIDKNDLIQLVFSKDDIKTKLRWEHSGEFEFEGQMYDVVESCILRDSIYYLCWPDKEETRINRQIKDLITSYIGKDPQKKENQQRLKNYCKDLFFLDFNPFLLSDNKTTGQKVTVGLECYSQPFHSPPVPPPEFI